MTEAPYRTSRRTCVTVAAVLATLSAWRFFDGTRTAAGILAAAAVLVAACALSRRTATAFHRHWMGAAERLGRINGAILLSLAFFLIVTPLGALRRRLGGDPLLRRTRGRTSYWISRERSRQSKASFERAY